MGGVLEEWCSSTSMSSSLDCFCRERSSLGTDGYKRENCYSLIKFVHFCAYYWHLISVEKINVGCILFVNICHKIFQTVRKSRWIIWGAWVLWEWEKNWLPSSLLPNRSHIRKFCRNTADVIILALYGKLEINFFGPLYHNPWLIFLCSFLPRLLYKCLRIQSGRAVCSPFMILL